MQGGHSTRVSWGEMRMLGLTNLTLLVLALAATAEKRILFGRRAV